MLNIGSFLVMTGRQAGGPETYERCILEALARLDGENRYHTYCLSGAAPKLLPAPHPRLQHHVLRPQSLRVVGTALDLPWRLLRDRIDLLHVPFTPPPWSATPYVFTHHCFSTFNHPEFYDPAILYRLNSLLKIGLRKARQIICVSRCTLELTADLFKLDRSRMHTIYNGVGAQYKPVDAQIARSHVATRFGVHDPYLLYLGKVETRKNIARIVQAFDQFRSEAGEPIKLLIVGRRSPRVQGIDEALSQARHRQDILEIGYADDADLPALYSGALAFVFPTLWEGFGIPVAEAMACGTPVITSNLSSLPEVAGDAGVLVDPYRVEDIAAAMYRLWTDSALRQTLRERGLVNARRFSWDNAARQTMQVFGQALA
jgi:glycosyltransferase involved in cell wall biosynthesis